MDEKIEENKEKEINLNGEENPNSEIEKLSLYIDKIVVLLNNSISDYSSK